MGDLLTREQVLERIFAAKKVARRKRAELPFVEKILMVLQLQKRSRALKQAKPAPKRVA